MEGALITVPVELEKGEHHKVSVPTESQAVLLKETLPRCLQAQSPKNATSDHVASFLNAFMEGRIFGNLLPLRYWIY